jgi:hypothetical protein
MDKLFDEHLPKFFLLLCAVYLWACQLAFTAPGVIGALIVLGVALWREHELKMRPKGLFATYLMPPRDAADVKRIFEFAHKDEKVTFLMEWNGALRNRMRIDDVFKAELSIVKREDDKVVMLATTMDHVYTITVTRYRNFAGAVDHRWTIVKTSIVGNVEQYRLVDESVWFTESGEDMDPLRSSRYHYAGFALPSKQTDQAALAESGTKPKPEVTIEKAGMSSCSPKITIAVSDIDWEALQRSSSVDFLLKKSS